MKPVLQIDLEKIKHNTRQLVNKAREYGVSVAGITKGCCGNEAFAKAQMEAGVDLLADSRIENLKKLNHLPIPKMLLRSPKLSEVNEVVTFADYSLNSDLMVIRALDKAAAELKKKHGVILMVDVGDLREGIWHEHSENMFAMIDSIVQMKGIVLEGLGTNVTCFGGIMPTEQNYGHFISLGEEIRGRYGIDLPIISGGNSSILQMLYEGRLPKGVTQLRVNQAIYLGMEIGQGNKVPGWTSRTVSLKAEIIEIQEKPSLPQGETARMNAFGDIPLFEDKGLRKRAIVAIGRQDMDVSGLTPYDSGITIEGASSDHLILDLTEAVETYQTGDWVLFEVATYSGILTAMASPYIHQEAIHEVIQCY
ncbi:alanine/ornithine racemase family PLP-dependent enzyme [Bacillus sp. 1P06AnD]|uniref:alanine/ornithine racemase family PLP-dependent enzyme n=1 Tax=Bacillus sp. 1P06AnD TaxID=3132208 RepID=UPI00399F1789